MMDLLHLYLFMELAVAIFDCQAAEMSGILVAMQIDAGTPSERRDLMKSRWRGGAMDAM